MNPESINTQTLALKLLAALYAQGAINTATYRNAVGKYGKSA